MARLDARCHGAPLGPAVAGDCVGPFVCTTSFIEERRIEERLWPPFVQDVTAVTASVESVCNDDAHAHLLLPRAQTRALRRISHPPQGFLRGAARDRVAWQLVGARERSAFAEDHKPMRRVRS